MAANTLGRDYDINRTLEDYLRRISFLERRLRALFGSKTPADVATQACRVTRSSNQSIPHATFEVLDFNDETFDNNGMHDNSVNNSRITINVPGIYDLGFYGEFESGSYLRGMFRILVNGSSVIAIEQQTGTTQSIPQRFGVSTIYSLNEGDYVEIDAFQQNSGTAAREIVVVNGSPSFWAARIGGGAA